MKYLSLPNDPIVKHTRINADDKVNLKKGFDPSYSLEQPKEELQAKLAENIAATAKLQDILYAASRYSLLIVFQAMDAGGKDGTIKHVFSGVNPQGCHVTSFKAPSEQELGHDYLWRCVRALPERGRIGVFNRSYYEEVLISRIHPDILEKQRLPNELIDKGMWKRRFEEINTFEKYLTHNGTVIIKFFLNISKEEQKKRFLDRIDRTHKNYKFAVGDAKERGHWDEYMDVHEECLHATSTDWAPWYVVPGDHKPTTRLCVSHVVRQTLESMGLKYPDITQAQKDQLLVAKSILESEG